MEKASARFLVVEDTDWQRIYGHLLPRVYHFFFYRVGDRFSAEELTAITFEKAWTSRGKYRKNTGAFQHWVFGIAQNVAADHFRKTKRNVPLDALDIPSGQNVETEIEKQAEHQRLALILKVLTERERLLVSLKYGAELSNREIARQTGLSESNVGTILFRVVARLREEWEK